MHYVLYSNMYYIVLHCNILFISGHRSRNTVIVLFDDYKIYYIIIYDGYTEWGRTKDNNI